MSIPYRTESARIVAGSLGAATLAGAAALHGLWGAGSTWPTDSPDELADLVVGRRPMPGRAACFTVAVLLTGAAVATAHATIGGGRSVRRSRTVATFASVALLARGLGGAVAEVAAIGHPTPQFSRWNRLIYSPLCVVLGLLIAAGRGVRS